jgi:hypothetical protein
VAVALVPAMELPGAVLYDIVVVGMVVVLEATDQHAYFSRSDSAENASMTTRKLSFESLPVFNVVNFPDPVLNS